METIKSYTDIEQSKKLAEILPLESADMCYLKREINDTFIEVPISKPEGTIDRITLPCWSLAALYGILPNNKKESTTLSRGGWKIEPPEYIDNWWCEYEDDNHTKDFAVSANNPIDACFELILKLHELNLL